MRRAALSALVVLAACSSEDDGPVDTDAGETDAAVESDSPVETDAPEETDTQLPEPGPLDVAITPEAPLAGEALTCTADTTTAVAWRWLRDGADAGVLTASVPEGTTKAYETWTCTALTVDGLYAGEDAVDVDERCRSLATGDETRLVVVETLGKPKLQATDHAFTIEGWVWHTGATGRQDVFRQTAQLAPNRIAFLVSLEDDQLVFRTYDDPEDACATLAVDAPAADGWHHVAASWEPTQGIKQLYVDGVSKGSCETTARPSGGVNGNIVVGGAVVLDLTEPIESPYQNLFQGFVDEVRLSSVERYIGSFTPATWLAPDADTLVLLHMNEVREVGPAAAPYEAVPDESGNGFHGKVPAAFPGLSDDRSTCELRP